MAKKPRRRKLVLRGEKWQKVGESDERESSAACQFCCNGIFPCCVQCFASYCLASLVNASLRSFLPCYAHIFPRYARIFAPISTKLITLVYFDQSYNLAKFHPNQSIFRTCSGLETTELAVTPLRPRTLNQKENLLASLGG